MMRTIAAAVCTLAVACAASAMPTQYIDHRPVRGVWLRPPDSASLDAYMQAFRDAGITDVYLETFYHGKASNFSFVFQRRFTFDYLLFAIQTGAKYNIRVHAWLETGYWGWQGSADYLLNANPDWQVVNIQNPATTGDITGQDFVNLGNPGVQQKLADYVTELTGTAGLWGIQIDYHRFPVGPTGQGPYSYDNWARTEFQNIYGVDPQVAAASPGDPWWNTFTDFRRDGISQCANVMHQALNASEPALDFSAAIFASAMTSSTQLSKMQNWPEWALNGYIETVVPMAYGPTSSSITNDLNLAQSQAPGARIVAGLALDGASPHPFVTTQMNAVQNAGLEEFVLFDGVFIVQNPSDGASLKNWLDSNALRQREDFDDNGYIDARDRVLFDSIYQGTPVPANGSNERYDLDESGTIDQTDLDQFEEAFADFSFGPARNALDIAAIEESFSDPPYTPGAVLHIHDLDGDGDVDYDDQLILHSWLTEIPPIQPDVNGDFFIDLDDLYDWHQNRTDLNYDGVIDAADNSLLQDAVRAGELQDMMGGQQP